MEWINNKFVLVCIIFKYDDKKMIKSSVLVFFFENYKVNLILYLDFVK